MSEEVTKLLPCPFCGGEPRLTGLPKGMIGKVRCRSDDCFGPCTTAITKRDSIAQWNRRPPASLVAVDRQAIATAIQSVSEQTQRYAMTWTVALAMADAVVEQLNTSHRPETPEMLHHNPEAGS